MAPSFEVLGANPGYYSLNKNGGEWFRSQGVMKGDWVEARRVEPDSGFPNTMVKVIFVNGQETEVSPDSDIFHGYYGPVREKSVQIESEMGAATADSRAFG